MRLLRIVLFALLAAAAQTGWAQAQPEENPYSADRDFTKTVHIFPNPATEFVHVKLEQFPASKVKLTLHNIIGNQVEIETEVVDEHEIRVKVKDLASGYYLLAVREEEAKYRGTFKFLKR